LTLIGGRELRRRDNSRNSQLASSNVPRDRQPVKFSLDYVTTYVVCCEGTSTAAMTDSLAALDARSAVWIALAQLIRMLANGSATLCRLQCH
jgi:hypothetical protein